MQQGMIEKIWRESLKNYALGLMVNLAAILAITYILLDDASRLVAVWSAVAMALMLLRFMQFMHAARRYRQTRTFFVADKFYLCLGLLAAGVLWAWLGWWGIAHYQGPQQFAIIVILSALAGGATGTLASLRVMGKSYILLLLLPACVRLLQTGIAPFITLAVLGLIFAAVMLFSHENNYKLIRHSVGLALSNQALLDEVSSLANALQRENNTLEARVAERSKDLLRLAYHDELTGLLNRHGVSNLVKYFGITPGNVTVFFLNLNRFKQINDSMGHEAGDAVLRQVAQRLEALASRLSRDIFSNVDCQVGRWGGDEFIFYLAQLGEDAVPPRTVGRLIRDEINSPMTVAGKTIAIDASIGAVSESDCDNPNNLFLYADIAAGEAKRTGCVVFFNPGIRAQLTRKSTLAQDLRMAIANRQLFIVCQPIVSAADHQLASFEVLLRWTHPELGPISPAEFIPVAEESGSIVELGDWVIGQAIAAAAALLPRAADGRVKVAVNVSLHQLLQDDFADKLLLATSQGFAAENLIIELTESVFHENEIDMVKQVLFRIKQLGVEIHIDDFGTGYSSFSRICQLPIDAIKIDKAFIQSADEKNTAIIEAVVFIAQRLKIRVIAEGIETVEQAQRMQALGVNELQGYLFGKPQLPGTTV
ncbi:diguanylate cyclase [Aquitalea magnusonii]|uniref:Diguanylate cyclase n=2 Tax=Aquitalea magnusonii TaxID=332411 RepID=A0A3G9GE95_9NEIS|nr:diguanylate cyclase [Aquitalea magnusonii]